MICKEYMTLLRNYKKQIEQGFNLAFCYVEAYMF